MAWFHEECHPLLVAVREQLFVDALGEAGLAPRSSHHQLEQGSLGGVVGAVAALVVPEIGETPVDVVLRVFGFAEPVVDDAGQAVQFGSGVVGDAGGADRVRVRSVEGCDGARGAMAASEAAMNTPIHRADPLYMSISHSRLALSAANAGEQARARRALARRSAGGRRDTAAVRAA
ncbi:hypothetical protein [Streptomyces kanasensis]|uniref:hypothetical protein n=1 Tax=Streptomyces kanasensis TaxID=936756 RepID=UPI0037FD3A37